MIFTDYRNLLEQQKGQRDTLLSNKKKAKKELKKLRREEKSIQEARAIIQKVATETQKELEYKISELSSLAMEAVFEDPYKLNLLFEIKREKSEAKFTFQKENEEPVDPLSSSGGGPIDVASFALQIGVWNLKSPRPRPTIIMDEPFKHVSQDLQVKVSEMLKEISRRLEIQFIIVSHEKNLIEHADNVIEVAIKTRTSKVGSSVQ